MKSLIEKQIISKVKLVFFFLLFSTYISFAQDSEPGKMEHPDGNWSVKPKFTLGLSMTQLHRDIIGEQVKVPMLEAKYQISLTDNINLKAGFSSCYLTSYLSGELEWLSTFDNISFGIGNEIGVWLGQAKIDGFDAGSFGIMVNPNASFIYHLDQCNILAKAEAKINFKNDMYFGNSELIKNDVILTGIALTLLLEKPIFSSSNFLVGTKLSLSEPDYLSWMVHSQSSEWLVTPKLIFGFTF